MNPLRAGVIGLGIGEQHAETYDNHPNARLTALCDLDSARLAALAARFPDARTTVSADEVLDASDVDVVSIASFDSFHAPQVLRAIARGKHVFVEKPMCVTAEEARAIRAALHASGGLRLSSNLILRRSPRFLRLRELIQSGSLGEIYAVDADYLYGRPWKLTAGWRAREPSYSLVLGGAVHMIDLALWLTGARAERVTAVANKIATRDTAFRPPDYVAAQVECSNGMILRTGVNGACMRPHHHALTVYGTRATYVHGADAGRLFRSQQRDGDVQMLTEPYPGYHKGELISSFLDAILRGAAPVVTEEDVFAAMSVCFAVEEAVARRESVSVRYL